MTIEFHCLECQKLLRVTEEAAGKKARCPDCGNIQDVPLSTEATRQPQTSSDKSLPTKAENPFAGNGANPFAERSRTDSNPFVAPTSSTAGSGYSARNVALAKTRGPAIGMTVVAIVMLVISSLYVVGMLVMIAMGEGDEDTVVGFIGMLLLAGIYGLALVGASKMKKLEKYGLAFAAAILMVIPCSPCFLFSLPFGIWALVILCDPQVKDAFS